MKFVKVHIKNAEKLFLSLQQYSSVMKYENWFSFYNFTFVNIKYKGGDKTHTKEKKREMWRLLKFSINFIIMCVIILKYPVLL